MKKPLVSAIILNWNRKEDTASLIKQLKKQTFKNFEIILVDNHSADGSPEHIKRYYPWVRLVEVEKNLALYSFNLGMKTAKGRYFLLLSCDTVIPDNLIEKHVGKLKSNPGLGVSCPSAYLLKTKKLIGPNRAIKGDNQKGYRVTYFDGNGICLRQEVFKKTGGFSKDYFICLEELEWAVRVLKAGFEIACFTDVKIYHKKTKKGGEYRQRQGFYYCRNWIWFYLQYLPIKSIPSFLKLHLGSFFKKTRKGGSMEKGSCFQGLLHSLLLVLKYIKSRDPVNQKILTRVKADLFPNPDHLYFL